MEKYGWIALLLAVAGEILVPLLLALRWPHYRHSTMVLSVLGSPGSPVRSAYNLWMLALGLLLFPAALAIYLSYRRVSAPLAAACALCVTAFALGACVIAGLFPANATKAEVTTASRIHGAGSALGFMLLLLAPLLLVFLCRRAGDQTGAAICAICFLLALAAFVLFVLSDKPGALPPRLRKEGLWQRLSLYLMYLPLVILAMVRLLA